MDGKIQSRWVVKGFGPCKYALHFLKGVAENRPALLGLAILLVLVGTALLGHWLAPHDPLVQNLKARLTGPCWEYPFGTDDLGRCVLSRVICATRISLMLGAIIVGITAIFGSIVGLISGFRGGVTDEIIMRIVDVFLAFPGIILALVIAGILGPGLFNVMLALVVTGWTGYARLVRGCVMSAKERTFIEATKAIGGSSFYTMFRHILPEVVGPVIVMATLGMGWAILSAAALSFLGLGAQPPLPEWGSMLNSGRAYMKTAWYLSTFPGLAIMMSVLACNFLGDGLQDALGPKEKKHPDI
jgi:peptide/nickel transport system permease protein